LVPLFSLAKFEDVGRVFARPSCPYSSSVLLTLFSCAPLVLSASLPCSFLCVYPLVKGHSHPLLRKQTRVRLAYFQFFT